MYFVGLNPKNRGANLLFVGIFATSFSRKQVYWPKISLKAGFFDLKTIESESKNCSITGFFEG